MTKINRTRRHNCSKKSSLTLLLLSKFLYNFRHTFPLLYQFSDVFLKTSNNKIQTRAWYYVLTKGSLGFCRGLSFSCVIKCVFILNIKWQIGHSLFKNNDRHYYDLVIYGISDKKRLSSTLGYFVIHILYEVQSKLLSMYRVHGTKFCFR